MVESFHMLWGFKHYTEQLAETHWREQVPSIHHKLFALHCAVSGNICLQFKLHLSLKLTSLESPVWRHSPDEAVHLGSKRTIRPCRWKSSSRESRGETNPAKRAPACSLFLNVAALFDLKLKGRRRGSTELIYFHLIWLAFHGFPCIVAQWNRPFWVSSCCPHTTLGKHSYSANKFCRAVSWRRELPHTHIILPCWGVVTSILPMSHQGASGAGYVQTIASCEVSTYREAWGQFHKSCVRERLSQYDVIPLQTSISCEQRRWFQGFPQVIVKTRE